MEFIRGVPAACHASGVAHPGRSAIDAVASFVNNYSLALLLTDRVYREGRYTAREAAIIATGFSTVSWRLHGDRGQGPGPHGPLACSTSG